MRLWAPDAWLSPDGNRVVYDQAERGSGGDLWIRDLARSVTTRFTFDAEREFAPIWSPDGRTIVFSKETAAGWDFYVKDAAGTGEAKPLIASPVQKFATDWSSDGRYLIFNSSATDTGWDLTPSPSRAIARTRSRFSKPGLPTWPAPYHPTAGSWLISRTSRDATRFDARSSPRRGASGRCRARGRGAVLAARWPRAVLPGARSQRDGGSSAGQRRDVPDRHAAGALPCAFRTGDRARQIPPCGRWTAVPGPHACRRRRGAAGDRGAELDGGDQEGHSLQAPGYGPAKNRR